MRRAQSITIPFFAEDALNPGYGKDGIPWAAGDVKLLKDSGSAANTTNLPVAATGVGSHKGLWAITLTTDEANFAAALLSFQQPTIFVRPIPLITDGPPIFAVVSNGGNGANTFKTDRTETATDYWKRALVSWITGNLKGQHSVVTGYDGTTKFVTTQDSFTGTPAAGDLAELVVR